MRDHIKFGMIRTEEGFKSLMQFAESFDHKVGPDSILPIYTIERGQHLIGYYNLLLLPIVCPALHPKICTPRDFHNTLQAAKSHFCLSSISEKFPNGTCFMAIPAKATAEMNGAMEHSGFVNTKKELWQAIP